MDTMVVLCCMAMILFSISNLIYINKEITGSLKRFISKLLEDIDEE